MSTTFPGVSHLNFGDLLVSEAVSGVVVHEADGLHEGVADGWTDELESLLR